MFHLNSFPLPQVGRSAWCQTWYTPPSFTKRLLIFWLPIQLDTWLFDLELLSDPEESGNIPRNQEPMDKKAGGLGHEDGTGFWGLEDYLFLEIQSLLRKRRGFSQLMAMALWLGLDSVPHHCFPDPNPVVLSVHFIIFCHHFLTEPQNRIIKQTKICLAWD